MSYNVYSHQKEELLKKEIIPQTKKNDFSDFWEKEVEKLRRIPLTVKREKLSTPYDSSFLTYKISYNTHDDTVVNAYFSCPVNKKAEKLPCVARYHGGGGKKRIYHDILATGVCCFAIDVRSQGGTTIDKGKYSLGDTNGGFMSRDVTSKDSFYMKNIYLDAVRAIDVISSLEEVDSSKIVTFGESQGGALSIVAAALSGKVKKSFPAVTSYCCLEERVFLGSGVFDSTRKFLNKYPHYTDEVMDTLSYFDINNMVSLLKVPVSFLLGLNDPICLPQFVYSAYSHVNSPKEIIISPFTVHEISDEYQNYVHGEFAKL